jgi:hypothetical protein
VPGAFSLTGRIRRPTASLLGSTASLLLSQRFVRILFMNRYTGLSQPGNPCQAATVDGVPSMSSYSYGMHRQHRIGACCTQTTASYHWWL